MIKLHDYFDQIYMLTMSSRKDRQDAMFDQFKQVGICPDEVNVFYATSFPYNDLIADAFNKSGKGRFTKPNEFDCARNHYSIIKSAYDRGMKHILVFEDDLRFCKDNGIIANALETMPEDYDVIQFGGFTADPNVKKYLTKYGDVKFVKHPDVGLWNCSMYALSRKGMEFYLAFMSKLFWVADGPLYKAPLNKQIINTYMTSMPIVIQADKKVVSSDIRDEKTDDIDYENQNMYESKISKENYHKYNNK